MHIGVHAIFGGFLAGLIVPREGGLAIKMMEKMEDIVAIVFLPLVCLYSPFIAHICTCRSLDHGCRALILVGLAHANSWHVVLHHFRIVHQSRSVKHGYDMGLYDCHHRHCLGWEVCGCDYRFVLCFFIHLPFLFDARLHCSYVGARLAAIGGGGVGKGWRECSTVGILMSCKGSVYSCSVLRLTVDGSLQTSRAHRPQRRPSSWHSFNTCFLHVRPRSTLAHILHHSNCGGHLSSARASTRRCGTRWAHKQSPD